MAYVEQFLIDLHHVRFRKNIARISAQSLCNTLFSINIIALSESRPSPGGYEILPSYQSCTSPRFEPVAGKNVKFIALGLFDRGQSAFWLIRLNHKLDLLLISGIESGSMGTRVYDYEIY